MKRCAICYRNIKFGKFNFGFCVQLSMRCPLDTQMEMSNRSWIEPRRWGESHAGERHLGVTSGLV